MGDIMVKRVSLTVANDTYENLAALSDHYGEDVQDAIKDMLEIISMNSRWVTNLKDNYKVPVGLRNVLAHIIGVAFHSLSLFNKVLEKMDVKGLYTLEDFEVDLDENYMWLFYDALAGCHLKVDAFDITIKPGLKRLTTFTYIEVRKNSKRLLEDLKKFIQNIQASAEFDQIPEEFEYLEDYDIEIIEEGELWTLQIDCIADSFDNLPSIRRISRFIEQIFKKFKIKK